MIEQIQTGIITAIRGEFDPNKYEIYTESVEQGLREPCFFVLCINPSTIAGLGTRSTKNYQFMIQYFPSSDEPRTECLKVGDILSNIIDNVKVGDLMIHSTGETSGNVVDGVLNFVVTYIVHTAKAPDAQDDMGTIEYERLVK